MKLPNVGSPRQFALLALLAGVLILAVVKWRGGSAAPAPSRAAASPENAPVPSRGRGRQEKVVSPEDVPIVTTEDLNSPRRARESEGRNIFDFRAPTAKPLPSPTPAPPSPPAPGSAVFVGPLPPPGPTPTPVPPEITFKFIGTFGPKDQPIAVLIAGDQIVNARAGEVVFERFIVRRIGYESIDVGFVGPWRETRRVGITQ